MGITRAQKRLFISRAKQRMLYNQVNHNAPSRFLEEIPERLLVDELASMNAAFGSRAQQQNRSRTGYGSRAAQPRQVPARPGMGMGGSASIGGLNIPGVQKGFVGSAARTASPNVMANLYKPGDRVRHLKFGEGNVVSVTGSGAQARIKIEFTAYGVKEFALSVVLIVKLED